MEDRRLEALRIRRDAAEVASKRIHPPHISNGEEFRYRNDENEPTHLGNYTKGLPHNVCTGVIVNADDYQSLVGVIDSGDLRSPLGKATLVLGF